MTLDVFYGWVGRFIRSAVAVLIAGFVAQFGDSQWYMVIAPALLAFFKALRDKYGIDIKVL